MVASKSLARRRLRPAAKIDDQPGAVQPPRDPALVRNRFMKSLGNERAAILDRQGRCGMLVAW
jgi:hypothetical protein